MNIRPTKAFCEKSNQQYPAQEHSWHPDRFTFDAFKREIRDLLKYSVSIYTSKQMASVLNAFNPQARQDMSRATILLPVVFSPSRAIEFADLMAETQKKSGSMLSAFGTFLFGASPTYKLDSKATQDAMKHLSSLGHEVALLLPVSPKKTVEDITASITRDKALIEKAIGKPISTVHMLRVGVGCKHITALQKQLGSTLKQMGMTSTHEELFKGPHVRTLSFSKGLRQDRFQNQEGAGNPEFENVLLMPDYAFSKTEMLPYERLKELPEVKKAGGKALATYLAQLETLPLGAEGTFEKTAGRNYVDRGLRIVQ